MLEGGLCCFFLWGFSGAWFLPSGGRRSAASAKGVPNSPSNLPGTSIKVALTCLDASLVLERGPWRIFIIFIFCLFSSL